MTNYFEDLIKYNDWANKKVLSCISNNNLEDHQTILQLMSHILSSQFVWHLRIKRLPTSVFPLWEIYKFNELTTMNEDSTKNWLSLIHLEKNFEREINYHSTKGEHFTNNLKHIMMHVFNHGTYHRAQIATLIKTEGHLAPQTDFILFAR